MTSKQGTDLSICSGSQTNISFFHIHDHDGRGTTTTTVVVLRLQQSWYYDYNGRGATTTTVVKKQEPIRLNRLLNTISQ